MKHPAVLSVILLLVAVAALAEPVQSRRFSNRLLSDVVQMTRAGLSDETIIAYVQARRIRLDADVGADDLIRLRQSGVSENVVRYIASASDVEASPSGPSREMTYDSSGGTAYPVEPSYAEDETYPYSYAYGYPYWYAYGYPYWSGYPYWYGYGPSFSAGFFVGSGRSFHGRGFDHRGSGHGSGGHRGSGGHHGSGSHGHR
jgi:hypothetical protein